jgi:hypothetical protein
MSDIFDGLARVRHTFLRENLKPPTVLLLESHEEGMRFLSNVRQSDKWFVVAGSPDLGHVVEMADGSAYMQIEVMGIKVRWPANRFATPDGSWSYV